MESPFCVGVKATGAGFVGREEKLEEYSRKLFAAKRGSISICGLPRIGKSSLVNRLLHGSQDLPERKIIVAEADNLGRFKSFYALWRWLSKSIKRQLEKAGLLNDEFQSMIDAIADAGDDYEELSFAIDILFEALNRTGIKTIVYIDEFDYVGKVFKAEDEEDSYYYFQLLRNLITDPKYNVSFIIVSRRSLEYLEERCCGGSVFHLAFDKQQLVGFDDKELNSFREVLRNCGVELSEGQWDDIISRAGRSPYLLSITANDLVIKKDLMSVDKIVLECTQRYYDYFKEIIELLKDEGYMKRMIQIFIGPKYDLLPQHAREMENRGYITFRNGRYETISSLFERYMLDQVRLDSSLDIWPLLTQAEKRLRLIIEAKMTERYGENWERIMREDYYRRCSENPAKYKWFVHFEKADKFIRDTRREYNTSSGINLLNVIGIDELANIIKFYWNPMFAPVFGNKQYSEWENDFALMGRARNPLAHSNPEYLTPIEIEQTNIYCRKLLEVTEGKF